MSGHQNTSHKRADGSHRSLTSSSEPLIESRDDQGDEGRDVSAAELTRLHDSARELLGLLGRDVLQPELLKDSIAALIQLVGATYGAVAVLDDGGNLRQFVHAGIAADQAERIGDLPQGRGLLGVDVPEGKALYVKDISQDQRSIGFPANHPHMKSLLVIPVAHERKMLGRVYLCDKQNGEQFNAEDEILARSLAHSLSLILSRRRAEAERNHALDELRQLNATLLEQRVESRTAELCEKNEELSAFAYSVSHDLRAPLRAIAGFSEIIVDRYRNDLDEKGRHYFDNIVDASKQMEQLIDDLLAYSRLGRQSVPLRPVRLSDVLRRVSEQFDGGLSKNSSVLSVADDLPTVLGDVSLLTQIFGNLIDNGLKYHRPGADPRVDVRWTGDGGKVVVTVADNGIGIAVEYHEKIFQVFQRLHSAAEFSGTGIGLAITKKAVRLLGGDISVESTPGEGSTFSVRLQPT